MNRQTVSLLILIVALTSAGVSAQTGPATAPAASPTPPAPAGAPVFDAEFEIFLDSLEVTIRSTQDRVELHYTLDGAEPTAASPVAKGPVRVTETTTLKAFRGDAPVGGVGQGTFTKVTPQPAAKVEGLVPGLKFDYYEGEWDKLPQFPRLTAVQSGTVPNFDFSPRGQDDHFAFRYRGYLSVPATGVYRFWVRSDEGARLYLDRKPVVEDDGPHPPAEATGVVALEAGVHSLAATYFEQTGNEVLEISFAGPGIEKQRVPDAALSHQEE